MIVLTVYFACSGILLAVVYALLPLVARRLLAQVVTSTRLAFEDELARRRGALLERGQEYVLSGPQGMIIGHLVEPHLRKFAGWISERLGAVSTEELQQQSLSVCRMLLENRRLWLAVAISQAVMVLVALGYLLRGIVPLE